MKRKMSLIGRLSITSSCWYTSIYHRTSFIPTKHDQNKSMSTWFKRVLIITASQKLYLIPKVLFFTRMPFYAVAKGRMPGIFMTWPDCEAQVKGFPGARYKKFDYAAGAQNFIETEGGDGGSKPATKGKKTSKAYPPVPEASTANNLNLLKRHIPISPSASSTTVHNSESKKTSTKSSKKKSKKSSTDEDSDTFTDEDDLNTILVKQLDDVEKRLKGFEKGVDKIIKKSQASSRKTILIEPPVPKRRRIGNSDFEMDGDGYAQVYTDGACSSNGRDGARAGIGVYWGPDHPLNVSEPVTGRATNNSGEIQAAIRAMQQAADNGVTKLTINTDSKFLIDSATKWMPGWKRNGWTLKSGGPVKNQSDFKELDHAQRNLNIKWNYVEAHRGVPGNEMADRLAKEGASRYQGNSRHENNYRHGNNPYDDN